LRVTSRRSATTASTPWSTASPRPTSNGACSGSPRCSP
jgi:hypothetical protein